MIDDAGADRDRKLSERLRSGDETALEEIYDLYSGVLYRLAYGILGSEFDAEDVIQEVFLKMVRRQGAPIKDLRAYLFTAARHESYSCLRRRRRETLEAEPIARVPFSSAGSTFEERSAVGEALQSLPPEQREVVILKIYEQLTFEEIGRLAKTSAHTVASRYRYAMKKLRELLGESAHVQ